VVLNQTTKRKNAGFSFLPGGVDGHNHVANKNDLLDGIVDIVIGEIEVPNLGYAKAAQEYIPNIPADKYTYMNRLTYYIIDGYYDGIADFNFGLELILDGLDKLRGR
jgi:hypothetical protein